MPSSTNNWVSIILSYLNYPHMTSFKARVATNAKNKRCEDKSNKRKRKQKKRKVNLADIPEVMILRRLEECVNLLYMTILRTKKE